MDFLGHRQHGPSLFRRVRGRSTPPVNRSSRGVSAGDLFQEKRGGSPDSNSRGLGDLTSPVREVSLEPFNCWVRINGVHRHASTSNTRTWRSPILHERGNRAPTQSVRHYQSQPSPSSAGATERAHRNIETDTRKDYSHATTVRGNWASPVGQPLSKGSYDPRSATTSGALWLWPVRAGSRKHRTERSQLEATERRMVLT